MQTLIIIITADRVFLSERQIGSLPRVEGAVVQVLQDVLLCKCVILKWVLCLGAARNYTKITDKLPAAQSMN